MVSKTLLALGLALLVAGTQADGAQKSKARRKTPKPKARTAAVQKDLEIQARNGVVSIRARAVPLSQVLDLFARETGARIEYEAARPGQRVSVRVEQAGEAEALVRLLEGQGLDFLLRTDPSGRRVESLTFFGAGVAAAGSQRARTAVVEEAPVETPVEVESEMPPPGSESDPGVAPEEVPAPAMPAPMLPGMGGPAIEGPGAPPGGRPGTMTPPGLGEGRARPDLSRPDFPQPASFPG